MEGVIYIRLLHLKYKVRLSGYLLDRFRYESIRVRFGSVRVISGSGYSGHSGSGQIGSIRVIFGSDLDRINKISGRFGFGLDHFGFRINSGQHDFGSVWFWIGSILISDRIRFRSFGCRFGFGFRSFGSVHSVRVSFARSTPIQQPQALKKMEEKMKVNPLNVHQNYCTKRGTLCIVVN